MERGFVLVIGYFIHNLRGRVKKAKPLRAIAWAKIKAQINFTLNQFFILVFICCYYVLNFYQNDI